MRLLIWVPVLMLVAGCSSRNALDRNVDSAYLAYEQGDCAQARLALSQAQRRLRPDDPLHAEIAVLRAQCLERQALFVDAAQTYLYVMSRFPSTEYSYRARARLQTLEQLGHYRADMAPRVGSTSY